MSQEGLTGHPCSPVQSPAPGHLAGGCTESSCFLSSGVHSVPSPPPAFFPLNLQATQPLPFRLGFQMEGSLLLPTPSSPPRCLTWAGGTRLLFTH